MEGVVVVVVVVVVTPASLIILLKYNLSSYSHTPLRLCRRPKLRGDPRHHLLLPQGHVRPLRHRDPRQHLLLHAGLPNTQVGSLLSLLILMLLHFLVLSPYYTAIYRLILLLSAFHHF